MSITFSLQFQIVTIDVGRSHKNARKRKKTFIVSFLRRSWFLAHFFHFKSIWKPKLTSKRSFLILIHNHQIPANGPKIMKAERSLRNSITFSLHLHWMSSYVDIGCRSSWTTDSILVIFLLNFIVSTSALYCIQNKIRMKWIFCRKIFCRKNPTTPKEI